MRSNRDLTKSDFIRAASMRSNGATWSQIRARLEVGTDSRVFYRYVTASSTRLSRSGRADWPEQRTSSHAGSIERVEMALVECRSGRSVWRAPRRASGPHRARVPPEAIRGAIAMSGLRVPLPVNPQGPRGPHEER